MLLREGNYETCFNKIRIIIVDFDDIVTNLKQVIEQNDEQMPKRE